ncbi:MAG: 2-hydroxyacyl-CoA dehydratase family protein [Dehalococcoidales bacterium]|nr:2-hydroxyacyl-CoA dehydratase family protein [Dehalococcoidales bacterium]
MYSGLLKLCGFSPEETEKELPRLKRAFDIWRITADDVKQAEERIERFFGSELKGMRKIRGIWLKEFVDMTLAKMEGKKVVYSSYPAIGQITSAMAIMSKKVYCAVPEPIIMIVMGQYFGKLGPILERAEKSWLPPGQAHCPYLQSRLASILDGMIAMPDLLTTVGVTCEQAGKTDEIIQYLKGVPIVHIDSCLDEMGASWPYPDPRRVRYLAQELKNVSKVVRDVIGLELTEETIDDGVREWSKLRTAFDELQELRGKTDPLPLSEKEWQNVFEVVTLCSGRAVREGVEAVTTLYKEVKKRVDEGIGVLEKGAPRVINLFAHASDPAVTEVIEKAGLASVVNGCTPSANNLPGKYEFVWEQIAVKTLSGGSRASATLWIRQLKEYCQEWNVDGLIIAALVKCRFHNIYPRKAKEVIEKELGIPVLAIEFDNLDSREYSAEYFRSRVEPFAEMLKNKKKMTLRS